MKSFPLKPLLFLTLGWFGIEMAMALDATQFQILLDHHLENSALPFVLSPGLWNIPIGKASLIALVLSIGPLAGITVQPLMGRLGDRLLKRGISRRRMMQYIIAYAWVSTFLLALPLNLWELIAAITLFFISFNALTVNYRAMITETSNRRALLSHKGVVSGLVAMFSGVGGFLMFMLFKLYGNSPWPPIFATGVLILTSLLLFRYAPGPGKAYDEAPIPADAPESLPTASLHPARAVLVPAPVDLSSAEGLQAAYRAERGDALHDDLSPDAHLRLLTTPWHWAFYVFPFISLIPAVERRLVVQPDQKTIFRLFLVVFFLWLGIQALRAFFVLLATKEFHVSYQNANLAMAVLTLVTVVSSLPLGQLADRLDDRRILIYSLAGFSLVCLSGFLMAHSFLAVIFMSVLLGIAFAGMVVMPLSMLFKLCPRRSEGTYSGLYNLFMSVPQLYSLFITGWLVDISHSYRVILLVGAVSVAGAMLLALRLPTDSPQRDPHRAGVAPIH